MDTYSYRSTVAAILNIYLKNLRMYPGRSAERVEQINTLYEYLLSADVKPILHNSYFDPIRSVLLTKIVEHRQDEYAMANWQICFRLFDTLDNLESFILYGVETLRRSDRLKNQHIDRMNKLILSQDCLCLPCVETATNLQNYLKEVNKIKLLSSATRGGGGAEMKQTRAAIKKNSSQPIILLEQMNIMSSSQKQIQEREKRQEQRQKRQPQEQKQLQQKEQKEQKEQKQKKVLTAAPLLRRSERMRFL